MAESSVFNFSGCKLALLYNYQVLVIRRDNDPSILFSGMLDVTGGTREGNESPSECAFRECTRGNWSDAHYGMHPLDEAV
ncbi:UNVERIFIED_ORG: hypothetical protein C7430_11587 [Pantoea agglomerans]|uniref:Nudix hydrolase domain-containing protein n=1 Tax=Enterobacter agglomerans TaxID=549 RepID=A0ABD6XKA9_ENTAG